MTTPDKSKGDRSHDEVLAGEYVVGVLDANARRAVEERMRRDRNFAAIVRRWEENLSQFDDDYAAQTPPPHLFSKIEGRLHGAEGREAGRAGLWSFLWSSVAVWRSLTAASVVALVFVLGDELLEFGNIPRPPLVAEMAGKDSSISLVARYDDASGRLRVTPVATGERAQHSLELWLIEGEKEPLSLGVLPQTGEGEIAIPAERRRQFAAGVVLAVSLEPFGGSPTGKATGPILALGEAHF